MARKSNDYDKQMEAHYIKYYYPEYLELKTNEEKVAYQIDLGLKTETEVEAKGWRLGWVCPKGKFYPLDVAAHERFLNAIFGLTILEAETQGWCRITSNCGYGSPIQFRGKKMTTRQEKKLFDLGFSEKDIEDGMY